MTVPTNLMLLISLNALSCIAANECVALSDFKYSLSASYDFVSCNSVETVIANKSGEAVFTPMDYPGVGPIQFLADDGMNLLLKTAGRKRMYPGEKNRRLEMSDPTKEFYFIVKFNDEVMGPFDEDEFQSVISKNIDEIEWSSPNEAGMVFYVTIAFIFLIIVAGITAVIVLRGRLTP